MATLQELGLTEDSTPQFDYDAPEAGMSPPPVYPGIYTLLFKMPDDPKDWFDKNEVNMVKDNPATKKAFLVINYHPSVMLNHATRDAEGRPVPNDATTNLPIQLGPQRASFFKSDKMMISEAGELLRAIG